ncbi:MAG: peptide chain release factor N(5)-glutamine methyltransferase [Cyclobacteriaceae bacterium]
MKNSRTVFQQVVDDIHLGESPEEIRDMAFVLLESTFGVSKTDIMAGKIVAFPQETALALKKAVDRINKGEPVQYVVGEEYFYGRKFHVNPSVLIPRPETEELVRAVMGYHNALLIARNKPQALRILDIGTGSGCIPITLSLEIAEAELYATDVSTAALSVAVGNAETYGAKITFIEHNILKEKIPLSNMDVIVSNPPYVTEKEKGEMKPNVLDHEPHQALFVSDVDPLIFYKAISERSKGALNPNGLLVVEINEKFGKDVSEIFQLNGFRDVEIVKDVAGKERIVKALNRPFPA